MNKNNLIVGIVVLISLVIGCKADKKGNVDARTPGNNPVVVDTTPEIPSVPKEVLIKLLNECTYIDYIFSTLPYSISQNEDPSIDVNISYIDYTRPVGRIPKDCRPVGRKFFHINGEIVYDVDVYLTPNCKFYVFVDKKNKPMYANYITKAGVDFYAEMDAKAMGTFRGQ